MFGRGIVAMWGLALKTQRREGRLDGRCTMPGNGCLVWFAVYRPSSNGYRDKPVRPARSLIASEAAWNTLYSTTGASSSIVNRPSS